MDVTKLGTKTTHYDEAVECVLYENGEPLTDSTGATVAVFVVSEYAKTARRREQSQKVEIAKLVRRYGAWESVPQADTEALDNQKLAACLTGWRGFEADGQPFPFTRDNAVTVLAGMRATEPALLKQIEGAVASHASFFATGSAT